MIVIHSGSQGDKSTVLHEWWIITASLRTKVTKTLFHKNLVEYLHADSYKWLQFCHKYDVRRFSSSLSSVPPFWRIAQIDNSDHQTNKHTDRCSNKRRRVGSRLVTNVTCKVEKLGHIVSEEAWIKDKMFWQRWFQIYIWAAKNILVHGRNASRMNKCSE